MARYIDADNLVERLKVSPIFQDFGTDGYFIRDMVIDLVGCRPTADVVPRAEVEEMMIGKANSLCAKFLIDEQEGRGKALMTEHDRELARGIFEELEKAVCLKIPTKITPIFKKDLGYDAGVIDGKSSAWGEFLVLLAELKKKYTEGGE